MQPFGQFGVGLLNGIETLLRSFFEILLFQGLFGDGRCLDDFLLLGLVVASRGEHILRQLTQGIDLQSVLLFALFGRHERYPLEILLVEFLLSVLCLFEFRQFIGLQLLGDLGLDVGALLTPLGIQLFEPIEIGNLRLEFHLLVGFLRNLPPHVAIGECHLALAAFGFYLLLGRIELRLVALGHLLLGEFVQFTGDFGNFLLGGFGVLQLFQQVLFVEFGLLLIILVVIDETRGIAGESLRLLECQPVVLCLELVLCTARAYG